MAEQLKNQEYPADKARQGEIILRKSWQKYLFLFGLFGAVILAFVLNYIAWF